MRIRMAVFLACAALSVTARAGAQEAWVAKGGSIIRSADLRSMVVVGEDMYLATRSEVYRADGQKEKWVPIFYLASGEDEIHCVAAGGGGIYVGTKRGLFGSRDAGKTWHKVFKAILPERNDVLSIDISRYGAIYLGTGSGVFVSENGGVKWTGLEGPLKLARVSCVIRGQGALYAGGDRGVYVKKDGSDHWERINISGGVYEDESSVSYGADVDEGDAVCGTCLAINGQRLYLGRGKKISCSDDGGKSWVALTAGGLAGNISCILPSGISGKIYCATSRGVFELSTEKNAWRELYRGTDRAVEVHSIVFDGEDETALWATTARGLYRFEPGRFIDEGYVDVEKADKNTSIIFDGEPAFEELQRAAIGFAEVGPDKIKAWRAQARLSAMVPKISFGIDSNRSNTYEIYTSATKDYVIAGPDDVSKGFDISISWELGNMIWSDDQTNIDVRSKLTTQLRNDILDDLRRAYYERKRLQYELIVSPPKDLKVRFEKDLRVRELTQNIDDLTGNYFTGHMKKAERS